MSRISQFQKEYTTANVDDYLKLSMVGDIEDKAIKYSDLLTSTVKNLMVNRNLNSYVIDSDSNLILTSNNTNFAPELTDGLSYIFYLYNIPLNWQFKPNINCNLENTGLKPLINGRAYDIYNIKNIDKNTLGSGIYKIIWSEFLASWKLYKLGQESCSIIYSNTTDNQAGNVRITAVDDNLLDTDYPCLKKAWGTVEINLSGETLASSGDYTPFSKSKVGMAKFNVTTDSLGSFTVSNPFENVEDVESSYYRDVNSCGIGSFKSSLVNNQSWLYNNGTGVAFFPTIKFTLTSTSQNVSIPSDIPTSTDTQTKRYGIMYRWIL